MIRIAVIAVLALAYALGNRTAVPRPELTMVSGYPAAVS